MAGRDNQRAGGGVLPNLVTPDGVDVQVARKRHYLAELQSQADADRARKAADRPGRGGGGGAPQYPSPLRNRNQGPSPPPFGAFLGAPQFAHAERGNDFAARLKQGFEAALQQAQVQVAGGAERYPDGPQPGGRDQGAEIMSAMRRWEAMFTGQVSASIQAISELNAHVVLLEEQISAHGREKQLLRERVEQAEMAQKELQLAKLEVTHPPRCSPRSRARCLADSRARALACRPRPACGRLCATSRTKGGGCSRSCPGCGSQWMSFRSSRPAPVCRRKEYRTTCATGSSATAPPLARWTSVCRRWRRSLPRPATPSPRCATRRRRSRAATAGRWPTLLKPWPRSSAA